MLSLLCSLYIRPLMFSSSTILGVAPTARTTLNITLSVAGPYFSSGAGPAARSRYCKLPFLAPFRFIVAAALPVFCLACSGCARFFFFHEADIVLQLGH